MARLTAESWLDAGLKILRDQGSAALTLENLCRHLKKTKGSFYHHFKDMNQYIGGLLEHWRQKQTQSPIDIAEQETAPRSRLNRLDETVRGLDHRLDQIIRAWAQRDPRAAAVLQEVDATRIAYLKKLFLAAEKNDKKAELMAELEYTIFLGAQQRFPDMNSPEAARLAKAFRDALINLE